MALFDGLLGGGGSDPMDIYGDLFSEKQRAALRNQQMTDTLLRLSAGFAKAGQASRLPTGGLLGAIGEAAGGLAGTGDEALERQIKAMQAAEQVKKLRADRALDAQISPFFLQLLAKEKQLGLPQGTLTQNVPSAPAAPGAPTGGPLASNAPPPPPAYQNPDMGDVPARPLAAPTATDAGDYLPGKGAGLLDPAAYGSSGGGLPGQGILPQFASLYGGGTGSQFPFDPTTSDLTGPRGLPDRRIQIEQLGNQTAPVDAPFPTVANPNKPASAWAQGTRYDRGDTPFDPARPYATPQQFAEPPSELDRLSQLMRVETGGKPPAAANLTGSAWEIANNNFGGMRRPGVNATPSQGGFQTFATPEAGLGAISNQLDRYASGATTGKPLSTIREIVSTWAPPSENDTEALIKRASRVMGVADNIPLDLSNPAVKAKLIEATVRNEQGDKLPVDPALIGQVANAPPGTYAASTGSSGRGFSGRIEPLGSDAVPAGAAPSGKIPGLDISPQGLAALNALTKMAGHGDVFGSLLETYYKSPDYLRQTEQIKKDVELQTQPKIEAAKAQATQQYIQANDKFKSELEIAKELMVRGGMVQQPDGSYKVITSVQEGLAAVDNAKKTGDIKEYEYYSQNERDRGGIAKPFAVWDAERRKASATSINTTEGLEAAQTKARIAVDQDMAKDANTKALVASQLMPLLDQAMVIARTTPEGFAGPAYRTFGQMAGALGIAVPPGSSNAELLGAINQRMIPMVREPGATAASEMDKYLAAGPALANTADGRVKIIEMTKAINLRAIEVARVIRNNIGAPDLHEKLKALDTPVFTDDQRAAMDAAVRAGVTPPATGGAPLPAGAIRTPYGIIERISP